MRSHRFPRNRAKQHSVLGMPSRVFSYPFRREGLRRFNNTAFLMGPQPLELLPLDKQLVQQTDRRMKQRTHKQETRADPDPCDIPPFCSGICIPEQSIVCGSLMSFPFVSPLRLPSFLPPLRFANGQKYSLCSPLETFHKLFFPAGGRSFSNRLVVQFGSPEALPAVQPGETTPKEAFRCAQSVDI